MLLPVRPASKLLLDALVSVETDDDDDDDVDLDVDDFIITFYSCLNRVMLRQLKNSDVLVLILSGDEVIVRLAVSRIMF